MSGRSRAAGGVFTGGAFTGGVATAFEVESLGTPRFLPTGAGDDERSEVTSTGIAAVFAELEEATESATGFGELKEALLLAFFSAETGFSTGFTAGFNAGFNTGFTTGCTLPEAGLLPEAFSPLAPPDAFSPLGDLAFLDLATLGVSDGEATDAFGGGPTGSASTDVGVAVLLGKGERDLKRTVLLGATTSADATPDAAESVGTAGGAGPDEAAPDPGSGTHTQLTAATQCPPSLAGGGLMGTATEDSETKVGAPGALGTDTTLEE